MVPNKVETVAVGRLSISDYYQSLKSKLKNNIERDCEVSVRSSSQQPPSWYVKCGWLQPRNA